MGETVAEKPSRGRGNLGDLLVLALAAGAFALAQTTVVPGLHVLSEELHASTSDVAWVMTGYLLSAAVLTPVVGRLGDMFGKRRMLIIALAVFTATSVLAALAPNIWVLVAARVIQGVGGGIFPLCYGVISDTFSAERRPVALGIISALAGVGSGAGLVIGGLLLDHASWPWIFWTGAIISGIALIGAFRLPDGGARSPGRIDLPGVLLLAVGLSLPLFAVSRTSAWGWTDARVLLLAAAGLAVLAVFVRFERRTPDPLVDMEVLGRPTVLVTNGAMMLLGMGMFGVFVLIPQLAQTDPDAAGYGFGLTATESGLLMLPGSLAMLVAASLAGRISYRVGPKIPLVSGAVLAVAGLGALSFAHGSKVSVIALSMAAFAGIGLAMAAMPNLIIGAVPREKTGEATGVNSLARSVGSSLGSQIVATLLAASATVAHPLPKDSAFSQAFGLAAGALVVAGVASVFIPGIGRGGATGVSDRKAAHRPADADADAERREAAK